MKKVLLFFILINLSLFAQSYINSLYDAIKENNPKKIIDIANNYKIDLNNIFYESVIVGNGIEGWEANASPLIYAIECKNIEAIDTLLKLGANVGQLTDIYSKLDFSDLMVTTNRISITPLMYAAYSSTEKVVSFLIKKGANVNAKNREGKTAIMYSVNSYRGLSPTTILINAGAEINIKDNKGITPLMYAASSHDSNGKELVNLLIRNKANINTKDNYGNTALMYACSDASPGLFDSLNPDIVKSLIRGRANINEANNYGNTALLYAIDTYSRAASWGEDELNDDTLPTFEVIKLLINNGANVNIKNKKGETPISLSKGLPKLTKLLRDNGAY